MRREGWSRLIRCAARLVRGDALKQLRTVSEGRKSVSASVLHRRLEFIENRLKDEAVEIRHAADALKSKVERLREELERTTDVLVDFYHGWAKAEWEEGPTLDEAAETAMHQIHNLGRQAHGCDCADCQALAADREEG